MSETVLDASALVAHARREPGHERVEALLLRASVSAVNLAEFVARMLDEGFAPNAVRLMVAALPCKIEPLNETAALETDLLRTGTRRRGLSLGDRACLALGAQLGLPVITADRAWSQLDLGVEVVLIR